MNKTLLAAAIIAALIIYHTQQEPDPEDQTGDFLDQVPDFEDLTNYASDTMNQIDQSQAQRNMAAILSTIRFAEGTAPAEGYRALFGWRPGNGKTFSGYASHPKQFFNYTNKAGTTIRTSAAGAYQITATTFDALVKKYGFTDFTPDTQDAMAIELMRERGAIADIEAGRFETAIRKIRPIWASLPGANVDQPERSMAYVKNAFLQAGGTLA